MGSQQLVNGWAENSVATPALRQDGVHLIAPTVRYQRVVHSGNFHDSSSFYGHSGKLGPEESHLPSILIRL